MKEKINELRENIFKTLKEFNIDIDNGTYMAVNNCKTQEAIDRICDEKFVNKWLSGSEHIEKYVMLEECNNNIKKYDIGNGLVGLEVNGERYIHIENSEDYL